MNLVSAQKGHWLSQRRIISPIFKNHVIEEISEFLCVWPKPNDGGGRSQDGDMKFGVLESTGYTTSSSSWCEGASHPGASHPPEYKTGHRRGWTRSPCSWNKGQQSTEEACLLQEIVGSAERTTRLRAVQGWPLGWRTCVGVGKKERLGVCVCTCLQVTNPQVILAPRRTKWTFWWACDCGHLHWRVAEWQEICLACYAHTKSQSAQGVTVRPEVTLEVQANECVSGNTWSSSG